MNNKLLHSDMLLYLRHTGDGPQGIRALTSTVSFVEDLLDSLSMLISPGTAFNSIIDVGVQENAGVGACTGCAVLDAHEAWDAPKP